MKRILLMEDDLHLLRLYTKILKNAGYRVIGVAAFQSALRMFELHHFDLFISDVQVGLVKTEVLLSELGTVQNKHKCPVLVISAQMETYQQRCDELNLLSLAKPFSSHDLLHMVGMAMRRGKRQTDLIHLSYISRESYPMHEADLVKILEKSRAKNEELSITGMLLYGNYCFVQVLEGPAAAVRDVFHTITQDERHTDIHKLFDIPKTEREFGRWSMGFRNLSNPTLHGYTDFLEPSFDTTQFALEPSEAVDLLMRFRDGLG